MGDLQKKLTRIADLCCKNDFSPEELFSAFGLEKDCVNKTYSTEDVFRSLSIKIGKEIYNNMCLLFVCFYLRKNLNGEKNGQPEQKAG